jgi:hypothetical protein
MTSAALQRGRAAAARPADTPGDAGGLIGRTTSAADRIARSGPPRWSVPQWWDLWVLPFLVLLADALALAVAVAVAVAVAGALVPA